MPYRVELSVFSGPMDLLLHLVKQQEVDIHEVRIADVLDQYLEHLKILESLDLSDLGEFLVMASTLMEIKSREILPREHVEIVEELSPKDDLIRRLLEYKRYRDISRRLDRLANRRSRMLEAHLPPSAIHKGDLSDEAARGVDEPAQDSLLDLGDVEIWSLTEMFAKLLEETGMRDAAMTVGVDKKDVRHYASQVLERVRGKRDVRFLDLFDRQSGRYGMIGVFIAVLEMMKQGVLRAHQTGSTDDITIAYVGGDDLTADEILSGGRRIDGEGGDDQVVGDDEQGGDRLASDHRGAEPAPTPLAAVEEQAGGDGVDAAGETASDA